MPERYRIEWAPVAQADLDGLLEYVASQDTVDAALHVYSRTIGKVETLASHPGRCRLPPELKRIGIREYRELIVAPYSIFFRTRGHVVGIVGVLDRRRDLQEILIRRALTLT
jgi:plasmid stabilization system protein ParE